MDESQTTPQWFFFLIESISFSFINWLLFPMQTTLIIHHICVFLISHKSYTWDGSFLLGFDKALFLNAHHPIWEDKLSDWSQQLQNLYTELYWRLQLINSQMTRKYCVILITNHILLKNAISRNQDQSANESLTVERIKFIACIIWSECFDRFTIKSWFPLAAEEGGNQSHLCFSHNLFVFQLNTDIKSLSNKGRALSLALCHTQGNASPTDFGDKIPIHFASCQRIDFYWHTGEQLIIYPSSWETISKGFI